MDADLSHLVERMYEKVFLSQATSELVIDLLRPELSAAQAVPQLVEKLQAAVERCTVCHHGRVAQKWAFGIERCIACTADLSTIESLRSLLDTLKEKPSPGKASNG